MGEEQEIACRRRLLGLGPLPCWWMLHCNCDVPALTAKQAQPILCIVCPQLLFTELNLWYDLKHATKHINSRTPLVMKSQKYASSFHEIFEESF